MRCGYTGSIGCPVPVAPTIGRDPPSGGDSIMWPVVLRAVWTNLGLGLALGITCVSAQDLPNLPPLTKEELTLKDVPEAKGAPAVILFNAVETDNTKSSETHSVRMKVLREEGRGYADLKISYPNKEIRVEDIRARSISPDGKTIELADQIYDQEIM